MEEQIPSSQVPTQPREYLEQQPQIPNQITPEMLDLMKAKARELAIKQVVEQRTVPSSIPTQTPPQVVYVRRNLTIAELLLILLISCGVVTGIQAGWNFVSNILPRLEIRMK